MTDQNVMMTPAEIATRDGVSRQAVTKTVRRLVENHGLPVERDGRGRVARFSVAHYDHFRSEFASSEKVSAGRGRDDATPSPSTSPSSTSREEALRQQEWIKVGREKIRTQEQLGQLVRADRLRQALTDSGRGIQSIVARLQNKADDMALAVSREGVHGLRLLLRQVAFDLNTEIADHLADVMAQAPDHDEQIESAEN